MLPSHCQCSTAKDMLSMSQLAFPLNTHKYVPEIIVTGICSIQTLFRLSVSNKQMNTHHLFPLCKECYIPQPENIFCKPGSVMTISWAISSEDPGGDLFTETNAYRGRGGTDLFSQFGLLHVFMFSQERMLSGF